LYTGVMMTSVVITHVLQDYSAQVVLTMRFMFTETFCFIVSVGHPNNVLGCCLGQKLVDRQLHQGLNGDAGQRCQLCR
jgi:hypothetical protein